MKPNRWLQDWTGQGLEVVSTTNELTNFYIRRGRVNFDMLLFTWYCISSNPCCRKCTESTAAPSTTCGGKPIVVLLMWLASVRRPRLSLGKKEKLWKFLSTSQVPTTLHKRGHTVKPQQQLSPEFESHLRNACCCNSVRWHILCSTIDWGWHIL